MLVCQFVHVVLLIVIPILEGAFGLYIDIQELLLVVWCFGTWKTVNKIRIGIYLTLLAYFTYRLLGRVWEEPLLWIVIAAYVILFAVTAMKFKAHLNG